MTNFTNYTDTPRKSILRSTFKLLLDPRHFRALFFTQENVVNMIWWILLPSAILCIGLFVLGLVVIWMVAYSAVYTLYILRFRPDEYDEDDANDELWHKLRTTVSKTWKTFGRIMHGYEVLGMDNIPETGGAVLVMYHGQFAVDGFLFSAELFLNGKILRPIVHDTLHAVRSRFRKATCNALHVPQQRPTVESCIEMLDEDQLLLIFPGGPYEGLYSGKNYKLLWRDRIGFARMAIEADVPIIPVFTENIRQIFIELPLIGKAFRILSELMKNHLPFNLFYGYNPVKLTTHIGKPIYPGELNLEELKSQVISSMEELIESHQALPGSIFKALCQRVYDPRISTKRFDAKKVD